MMNNETQGLGGIGSLKSTADLSGTLVDVTGGNPTGTTYKNGAGLFVIPGADGYFAVAGANALTLGVLNGTPKAGQAAGIDTVRGVAVSVMTGGAFAIGDKLVTDGNGCAVLAGSTAKLVCAIALQASTATGQLVKVMLVDSYVA
jgi:hypothetical protein